MSTRRSPVLRWVRTAPAVTFALTVVLVVALTLAVVVLVNPGHRVGPVRPAAPPVGQGEVLPAGP